MCCEKNLARLPEALRRSCSMAWNSRTNWPSEALRCSDPSFWIQSKPRDKRPCLERHEWWQPEFWGMKKFRVLGVLKNQGYTQSWIVWEKSRVSAEYIHSWLWLRYLGKSLQVDSSGSIGFCIFLYHIVLSVVVFEAPIAHVSHIAVVTQGHLPRFGAEIPQSHRRAAGRLSHSTGHHRGPAESHGGTDSWKQVMKLLRIVVCNSM